MRRDIKNRNGKIIGRIEERGLQMLHIWDANGNILGRYDTVGDMTYDKNGNTVGRGDQRMLLLNDFSC